MKVQGELDIGETSREKRHLGKVQGKDIFPGWGEWDLKGPVEGKKGTHLPGEAAGGPVVA